MILERKINCPYTSPILQISWDYLMKFLAEMQSFPIVWSWDKIYWFLLENKIIQPELFENEKKNIQAHLKEEARANAANRKQFKDELWNIFNNENKVETAIYKKIVLDYLQFQYPDLKMFELG